MTMPGQSVAPSPPDQQAPTNPDDDQGTPGYKVCIEPTPSGTYYVYKEMLDEEAGEAQGTPSGPAGSAAPEPVHQEFPTLEAALKDVLRLLKSNPRSGGEEAGFQGGHLGERQAMGEA